MRLSGKKSITRHVTWLFVGVSTAVLLALSLVIASAVERHFEEQDIALLSGKMELARHTLAHLKSTDDVAHIRELFSTSLIGSHGLEMAVFGPNHYVIFATPNAEFSLDLRASDTPDNLARPITWTVGTQTFRGIAAALPTGISEQSKVVVAVATDIAHHQDFMRSFMQTLWVFVIGAAVLTGLLGWVAVRWGLAPLRAMRAQTQGVTAQELGRRLEVKAVPVELAELAQALNDMLGRLEDAFHRLTAFSSDIAHELRTPVSNLMTQTQVALSRARSAEAYRDILESNAEEFEHMTRMIADMLLLAKAENDLLAPCGETVDLASEALALFDYYDAVAEEKQLQFKLVGQAQVNADRLMLRRALGNLLSNAVRHSTVGTTICIRLHGEPHSVVIEVQNTGDTIAPEFLERVFDRFFRIDPSRTRSTEGTGLGLAITRSIIVAHGGSITVTSDGGVTTFTIKLPGSRSTGPGGEV